MVNENFIALALLLPSWLDDLLLSSIARKISKMNFEIDGVLEKTENKIVFKLKPKDDRKLSGQYVLVFQRDLIPVLNVYNILWKIDII